ncbi:urease accessory protein UreD [Undibacterium sp. Di24W]|uniref:urease accessory protein UreD n=1 Tax=Undibacterium sp. Di24W TaxID=3413033 RepID=UPI003BF2A064
MPFQSRNETSFTAHVTAACEARLKLGFTLDEDVTRLTERQHFGPLRVQKPLYPEDKKICHAIIVHPPGGILGGDILRTEVGVSTGAQALISTPGAAKWYKANGKLSQQVLRLEVGASASLEWLPQETIFFDCAEVLLKQEIVLASDASLIFCDIFCFGRTASNEQFNAGKVRQVTTIHRDGKLIWFEQGQLSGGSSMMASQVGLADASVTASLLAVGGSISQNHINALREAAAAQLSPGEQFGATVVKGVTVVRYLGDSSEQARRLMLLAWQFLRPVVIGRDAIPLRVWNT